MTHVRVRWWASFWIQIALATTAVAAIALGATFAVLFHQVGHSEREALRTRAISQLNEAQIVFGTTANLPTGVTTDPRALPAPLRTSSLSDPTSYFDGTTMWAAALAGPDGPTLIVHLRGDRVLQERSRMLSTFALGSAGALAASFLLSLLVGQTIARRLHTAAQDAARIAAGESVRVREGGTNEVAMLAVSINHMADELQTRIEAEEAFNADVAHELRTPLTALVSSVELLPDDEVSTLVRSQVARLRRLVEDLLEISRLGTTADPDQLAMHRLGELVAGFDVTVAGDGETQVQTDARRVRRIIGNLIENSRRHAEVEPRIRLQGNAITVEDDGPGYPPVLLESGPRRFLRLSEKPGSGLGLTIAVRQAHTMGASLEFANKPSGGAITVLTLAQE